MPTPKTLGACADRLYKIKALKADLNKKLDALDDERKNIEAKLIDELPKDSATGVTGKAARATIIIKEVAQVEDWDKLQKFIVKTGSWDLMVKRVKDSAVQERWEDGTKVPGVVAFPRVTVSLNKV